MRPSELVKFLIRAAPDPAAAVTRHGAGRHFSCDLPGLRAPSAARARGGSSGSQAGGKVQLWTRSKLNSAREMKKKSGENGRRADILGPPPFPPPPPWKRDGHAGDP